MNTTISLQEYQTTFRNILIKEQRIGFILHSLFYIIINAGLIILNLLVLSGYKWFYWPLFGWGFGLSMHFIFGILLFKNFTIKKEIRAEKQILKAREN